MARSFCLLILFCKFAFGADQFIFWAQINSQNNIIKSEIIAISKAMILTNEIPNFVCKIYDIPKKNESSYHFLTRHQNELFSCFSASKIHIKDKSKLEDKNFYSNLILTLSPIRFEVEFKSDFAIINKFDKGF
ncbi:hypothetical protein CSPB12327_05720 [Campylobacter sp. RM12327]|uniref:hypothetical protein n=1 Tax=Campylobacter sputorum TaxID=206 RepID=UPI000B788E42|nr:MULTISPECIES: hypothetical protein [Campylobacter]ASM40738.1 flagellar-associated protein FlgQ [Campylobacter sputorum]MBE7357961.1 hypothetical protein [Campylobacter sp. RM11302]MBF6669637.1 hypothetical protein [Campylobacter sp. RM12327]MBF6674891.1 hypothetical protein [Campylobacter sp. RM13538]MBF6676524.1 hypothetical protein [Campylobacter sp. RM12321]